MKKTVITTLKLLANSWEIEAVEKYGNQTLPIFKDAINSLELSNLDKKFFIRNSKKSIEKLIKGKLNDLILLISFENIESSARVDNYLISVNNEKEDDRFLIVNQIEQKYLMSSKKIIDIVVDSKNKTNNSETELNVNISSISNDFWETISSFIVENELKIVKTEIMEHSKISYYNQAGWNIFLDINKEGKLNFYLTQNNKILKNEGQKLESNLLFENYWNTPYAYFVLNNLKTNNVEFLDDKHTNFEDFYTEIFEKTTNFIKSLKILNSNFINLNFIGKLVTKNKEIEMFFKEKLSRSNIYSLVHENEFVSTEMQGLINLLDTAKLHEDTSEKIIKTDVFTISSDVIKNIKNSKRKSIFA
ncbi:hypothetical protein PR254_02505 [Metamycoplasma hyosynoviae]|uniref:hypothetical protein n=1 Tax=Metamycoplasma hyosynoviae TaxID=29559 RepID=UPI0023595DCC|nr:hypothetical protein [Metamycoplasma hyosynoviae]MDC8927307.1 hypothetical protein [Metamycoplasma hyosynoviae]